MRMDRQPELKYAPREVFEQILEWTVVPTFDLVLSYGDEGIIVARRRIAPYKGVWAFPGLRMFKPEGIDDTLRRIAVTELGLEIDVTRKRFLGQFVGRFRSEHQRQDLSTGYHIPVDDSQPLRPNPAHFSSVKVVRRPPSPMGAMYRFYFERYLTMTGKTD
jgi:ADP-ribose pyrophosphatase YjhB (NUDIX family)